MVWSRGSAAAAPSRPEGQWQLRPPHQTQRRVRGGFAPPSRHPSEGRRRLGAAAGAVKEAAGAHNRRFASRGGMEGRGGGRAESGSTKATATPTDTGISRSGRSGVPPRCQEGGITAEARSAQRDGVPGARCLRWMTLSMVSAWKAGFTAKAQRGRRESGAGNTESKSLVRYRYRYRWVHRGLTDRRRRQRTSVSSLCASAPLREPSLPGLRNPGRVA